MARPLVWRSIGVGSIFPSAAMAMPPGQAMPGATPSPDVSKVRKGLRVAGIGLILASILYIFGPVGGVSGGIVFVIGSALVFSGRSAWPAQKAGVAAGFGMIVVGYIIGIVAAVLNLRNLRAFTGPLTSLTTLDVAAFQYALIAVIVAGVLTEIGVVVLPWRFASGNSKGLIAAGAGLSIVGLLLGAVLALGVLAGVTGGSVTTNQRDALVTDHFIGVSILLVGGIVAGVGYFRARGRLPAAPLASAM